MINKEIKKIIHQINEEIMQIYNEYHLKCWEAEKLAQPIDSKPIVDLLKDYVLNRPGWAIQDDRGDVLIYKNEYPIVVKPHYYKDFYWFMLDVAKLVMKAELICKFIDDYNTKKSKDDKAGQLIITIDELFKKEDWCIPFIRRRMPN